MTTSAFPQHYRVALVREGGHVVMSDGVKPPLIGGPPPERGGSPQRWSPEHLLLASAGLCFMTTFQALAARGNVTIEGYEQEVRGVLDKTGAAIAFVSIILHVAVTVAPGQAELAARLLQTAKKHCIVANSLKIGIDVRPTVKEEAALPIV